MLKKSLLTERNLRVPPLRVELPADTPENENAVKAGLPAMRRGSLAGSAIGGIRATQEMLDFCGKHKVVSDIEITPIQKVNEAYERVLKSDVRYRFVIDMASLKGR